MENIIELANESGLFTKMVRNGFTNDYVKGLERFAELLLASQAVSEPVAEIIKNSSGQICILDGKGDAFDMSKHIGKKLYTHANQSTPVDEREAFETWAIVNGYCEEVDDSGTTSMNFDEDKWVSWQARAQLNVTSLSENEQDAERFRWLTTDHDDKEAREKCRDILNRMSVMSCSAARMAIDQAITNQKGK